MKDETKVQNEICLGKGNKIRLWKLEKKIVTCKMNEKKKAESENSCFKMTVTYKYFLKSCVNIQMYAQQCEITNYK